MGKNFMVYAKGCIPENDIEIECFDVDDMNHYAQACREQGYKEVTTSMDRESSEQKCRVCGCTWNNACEGGCYWVKDDLCSKCANVEVMKMDTNIIEHLEKAFDGFKKADFKKGSKVRCISVDEAQSRWGGNDSAAEYLEIGKVYILARDPEVHSWHTKLYLEEVPGKKFNSVQFEEVE